MGKSEGSVRAYAKRNGYTITKLTGNRTSGGKYKYAIRNGRDNMRAANLTQASGLIRSTVEGRARYAARVRATR